MKTIVAKTGSYEKNGETKSEWTRIGVVLSNENGEYVLLDPKVNLAGIHTAQMLLAKKTGGKVGEKVMATVFTDSNSQGGQSQGGQGGGGSRDLDDEIPF